MATAGGGGDNSPWGWLGLLKWSLAYSDGTRPSTETMKPMSKEDIEFLEKVMKDGIIDEGERMKSILTDLTESLQSLKDGSPVPGEGETKRKELDEDEMSDLLLELKDIVEQIDYARAFMSLGGIPFLLGCAAEGGTVPHAVRAGALGVLATMCQNNPPVQLSLLENGHMPVLIQLFFDESTDAKIQERAVQALSCSVRSHSMAEHIFCKNDEGRKMIYEGIGMKVREGQAPPPLALRRRCLFFLRALLTADDAEHDRVKLYRPAIHHVANNYLDDGSEPDAEIREMTLQFLTTIIIQQKGADIVLQLKDVIGTVGVQRISAIRELKKGSEEREFAEVELEEWEQLLLAIAETSKKNSEADTTSKKNSKADTSTATALM